jgi:hypothetical protein
MNLSFLRRAGLFSAIGATLIGLASCININEELGQNLIPTHHQWDVFPSAEAPLTDIVLKASDSLSAYSTRRITFGAINDEIGSCTKASSFTLVPVIKDLDLGENTVVKQFHFSAVRDTLSTVYEQQERMMQNIYVYGLKEALDSTILYTNSLSSGVLSQDKTTTNREKFLNLDRLIAKGIPVYNGSDSLSFDFTDEFAAELVTGVKAYRKACLEQQDTLLSDYLKHVPGIYIEAETPQGYGGRINMFDIALEFDTNGYISGNYAELKITADYGDRKQVDTSFIFIYGPSDFIPTGSSSVPSQYAFNGSTHASDALYTEGVPASDKIFVEGGCGVKPVITAAGIKAIVHEQIQKAGIVNPNEVVINKATIKLPYDVNGDWSKLDRYPTILSPTVRLRGKVESGGTYVSYAGLTDASIESENQGDINRSLSLYSPDISHHVQEILKLQPEAGESDADFAARLAKYDIWMLIMHEEVTVTTSPGGSNNDYYNSLLYNSYYNNMMYDPYGYGYGYGGYGGYGYGGYGGYGYGGYGSNYYNYMMMASYMNSGSNSSESVSIDLDKDRYYNCTLAGPSAAGVKPTLSITFSAPKTAEKTE